MASSSDISDIKLTRGRPKTLDYADLQFEQKKIIEKGKIKYYALCLICNGKVNNTSYQRLSGHRNVCRPSRVVVPSLQQSLLLPSSSGDSVDVTFLNTSTTNSSSTISAMNSATITTASVTDLHYQDLLPSGHYNHNSETGLEERVVETALVSHGGTTLAKGTKRKDFHCKRNLNSFVDRLTQDEEKAIFKSMSTFFFGCNIPFSVVESDHFKNFVCSLRPSFVTRLPSRKTLSTKLLDEAYEACNSDVPNMGQHSVLLIDGWKNSSSNSKTVVTMLHNVSSGSLFLHAKDLTTKAETAENLLEVLEESIDIARTKYKTEVYCIVSDNASNMKKMGRLSGLWYCNCNSHTANLLAKDIVSYPDIKECVTKIHTVLKEFKSSDLERALVDQGGHRIVLPCDTRWCSYRDALFCYNTNLTVMRQVVAQNQIKVKGEIKQILFDDSVEMFCNDYIELLDPICELINLAQNPKSLLSDLTSCWLQLENNPNFSDNGYFQEVINRRKNMALNIYFFLCYYFDISKEKAVVQQYEDEIHSYLLEVLNQAGLREWMEFRENTGYFHTLRSKGITDPILFWKTAQLKYPSLSELALKILLIPPSSAEIERLFSNWSYVHSLIRNRLTFEKSQKLLFIYYTLKIKDKNKSDEY